MRFLVSLSIPVALAACASQPPSQTVQLGASRIAYVQAGAGQPVAVFQAGLGDVKGVWADVLQRLPPGTAVFAHDRPGYGGSGPLPAAARRDACSIARELRAVLQAAGQRPPYVLVGHSIGGLYQYAFARLYPDEVAGVLLVDPTHPDYWAHLQRELPGAASYVRGLRATVFGPAVSAEFDDQALPACAAELQSRPATPLPVRLLVRGNYGPWERGALETLLRRLQADWLALLPGATRREVEGAGHLIQQDRPDIVADELKALMQAASPR